MAMINLHEHMKSQDNFITHLIIEALTIALGTDKTFTDFLDDVDWHNADSFDVCLTINGYEFDILPVCDAWESQIDRMVKEAAQSLFKDELGKLSNLTHEFEQTIEEYLSKEYGMELNTWL